MLICTRKVIQVIIFVVEQFANCALLAYFMVKWFSHERRPNSSTEKVEGSTWSGGLIEELSCFLCNQDDLYLRGT
jgi:hypothetical protein